MKKIDDKSSDEQIINKVLSGDSESFAYIVKRYQKFIYSLGMRLLKNSDDSYDFTQEVFLKSFQKIGSFRGLAPFRYWLVRLAYNFGINVLKSAKATAAMIDESVESREKSPVMLHLKKEIQETLKKEINKLPENYRICLDMYFFLGLSYDEISKITEIPLNTIKSNVFRAKTILRDNLKGTIAEKYYEM